MNVFFERKILAIYHHKTRPRKGAIGTQTEGGSECPLIAPECSFRGLTEIAHPAKFAGRRKLGGARILSLAILTPPPNPIPNKTGNNKTHNQTPAAHPYLHVRHGS